MRNLPRQRQEVLLSTITMTRATVCIKDQYGTINMHAPVQIRYADILSIAHAMVIMYKKDTSQ